MNRWPPTGAFPKRALSLVLGQRGLHRAELLDDWTLVWTLVRERRALRPIAPLEQTHVPRLESAGHVAHDTIRVRFADGITGDIDLTDELWGEVFAPLKDLELCRRFRLDEELNTITWASGADLAPEFLYERAS